MIVNDDDLRRPEQRGEKSVAGWTSLHSWIFIVIVAVGLMLIGQQNRYHYLSPLGLGKAYRIDKLFGGIQEFDPDKGWVKAQLQNPPGPSQMSMMGPSGPPGALTPGGPPSMAMNMPGATQQPGEASEPPGATSPLLHKEEAGTPRTLEQTPPSSPPSAAMQPSSVPKPQELTKEERLKAFQKLFPDFGEPEFQLANDDLFPDWKKTVSPNGTWQQFLAVYKDFIQWWNDTGSPAESGFKLWRDFLASREKR